VHNGNQPGPLDLSALAQTIADRLAEKLRTESTHLLDRRELANRLRISERTVSALTQRNELPAGYLFGGVRRWDWSEVLRYLASRPKVRRRRGRGIYDREQ
jgi:excisionase family DNA binding protein